ncbi:GNAT family N-acetyltransferase [Paractinoplanes globisporus]|uniref:GNAT family N-acetyltransferase n=1 Tax=Paractinoplanes globisporus TaxID=113565 RepID=A0ABW6W6G5_9ACTN|nr:GNAT family N-acetyltransferase [Actinoplanes globisporus]
MTTRDLARRTAADLSALLAADSRAGHAWQQRMWQIVACLCADASDEEALRTARVRFEGLYAAGRDFGDFHLWRTDPQERAAVNERLAALTGRLRDLLHMPPVTLRRARHADAGRVAAIWLAGWRDGHLGNVPDELVAARTPETFRSRAEARVADTTVAEVGGVVGGFIMVARDEVEQVYVDAAFRGDGVADSLLAEAERLVAADGHPAAWLAVVPGNARARRFYERAGWVDDGGFDYVAASVPVPCRRYVKQLKP